MPKINQEEYEVLKGLDDRWKWIARNYNGALIIYTSKPMKNPNLYWDSFGERMDDRLFQSIQWEDEEPYNIQELIEEYLYDNQPKLFIDGQEQSFEFIGESEEEEMKKGIEWLKREIHKELEDWHGVEGGIDGDGINEIMLLINQLDEPEVLSSDWIDEHKENWQGLSITGYSVPEKDLQNLLVPKQEGMFNGEKPDEGEVYFAIGLGGAVEVNVARSIDEAIEILTEHETNYSVSIKTVIPKFVAEWIEKYIEYGYDLYPALKKMENNSRSWKKTYDWYRKNTHTFVNAYLTGKYEVEEEQKYVVELPNPNNQMGRHKNVFLNKEDGKVFIDSASLFVNDITKYGQFALTEEEIKKDFEWAWKFAKPVEELEE